MFISTPAPLHIQRQLGGGRGSLKPSEHLQGWGTESKSGTWQCPLGSIPLRVLKATNWGKAEKQQRLEKPKAFPLAFGPVLFPRAKLGSL